MMDGSASTDVARCASPDLARSCRLLRCSELVREIGGSTNVGWMCKSAGGWLRKGPNKRWWTKRAVSRRPVSRYVSEEAHGMPGDAPLGTLPISHQACASSMG